MTIDELIAAHWGSTVVLRGETPEAYAIRREEERMEMAFRIGWTGQDAGEEVAWLLWMWSVPSSGHEGMGQ